MLESKHSSRNQITYKILHVHERSRRCRKVSDETSFDRKLGASEKLKHSTDVDGHQIISVRSDVKLITDFHRQFSSSIVVNSRANKSRDFAPSPRLLLSDLYAGGKKSFTPNSVWDVLNRRLRYVRIDFFTREFRIKFSGVIYWRL